MSRLISKVILLVSCVMLTSCTYLPFGSKKGEQPENQADLTWEAAKARKSRLENVQYDLKVDLSKDTEEYSGELRMGFELSGANEDLRVDFFEGKVTKIRVNGNDVDLSAKKPYWIMLPAKTLVSGRNEVEISYIQKYSKSGQGLHRFKDPEDGQYYLHSQFETYDANKFMPCFDQPDLRAQLRLTVTAPKNWQVVTATMESSRKENGEVAVWEFPPSAKISTYLFSLHAGPYQVFKDTYKNIPLRIFIRPAIAKYLNSKEWFTITKQGFGYFEKTFDTPYPFKKYDQLVVPEFQSGGMENVAAVTYSEFTIPRSEPTREDRRETADLLLHEMAHMWFGDLVTMRWWNDLWLNESFATLMATTALVEATEYKEGWQDFGAFTKRGAYTQDALGTTHPIEAPVTTVKEADAIFDGITYNKGASVLKQLRFYITQASFNKGLQDYFEKHAWGNTELKDFIGALQKHTDKDLNLWAERWLRQSGTDSVAADWSCDGRSLKKVIVNMTPSAGAKFRPQAFELGMYRLSNGRLRLTDKVRVDITKQEPKTVHGDWQCPHFVYPNYNDQAYVNVKLDQQSLLVLNKNLVKMDDTLVRSLVWNDLWRMVRSSELPLKTYIEVLEHNFKAEKDQTILQQLVSTIQSSRGSVLYYWPVAKEEQRQAKAEFRRKMEDEFLNRLKTSKSGSDTEKFWFESLLRVAESSDVMDQYHAWFTAGRVSPNFLLDPDRKWSLVYSMMRFNHPKAGENFAAMKQQDVSDRGQKMALASESVAPNPEIKDKWVKEASNPETKLGLSDIQTVMYGLFPLEQREMKKKYEPLFFDFLKENKASEEEGRVRAVIFGLIPLSCEEAPSKKLKSELEGGKGFNPSLLKNLQISIEEDERCQRIRSSF